LNDNQNSDVLIQNDNELTHGLPNVIIEQVEPNIGKGRPFRFGTTLFK